MATTNTGTIIVRDRPRRGGGIFKYHRKNKTTVHRLVYLNQLLTKIECRDSSKLKGEIEYLNLFQLEEVKEGISIELIKK